MKLAKIAIIGLLFCAASSAALADKTFDRTVRPFLTAHCTKCHGSKKAKGKLRLDTIKSPSDLKARSTRLTTKMLETP